MNKEYWITWAYSSYNGHTAGSEVYSSEEARQKILDNKEFWRHNCFPARVFETINGEVV